MADSSNTVKIKTRENGEFEFATDEHSQFEISEAGHLLVTAQNRRAAFHSAAWQTVELTQSAAQASS